jgi:hypothetical protein
VETPRAERTEANRVANALRLRVKFIDFPDSD